MEKDKDSKKLNQESQQPEVREQGLTYMDYAALDDDNRYELVDGRLELMSPGPMVGHDVRQPDLLMLKIKFCY